MEAFRAELGVREPEDQVAELLSAMRRELVAARAAIPEYERSVAEGRAELERERAAVAECERRYALAEKIGDAETGRIAREFADRHRQKAAVIEQKMLALEAELVLRRREVEEMREKYQHADANRFALLAQLRAAAASQRRQEAFSSDDGAFADFARMEERMRDHADYVDALEELEDTPSAPAAETGPSLDERLEELKRRMGAGRDDNG